MKKCRRCQAEKPLTEFYAHKGMADGHLNHCKECVKASNKRYRSENVEERRAYDIARGSDPKRRKYRTEHMRAYRKRWPERYKARTALANALREGKLRKEPCEECGAEQVHAHHDDYTKPLDVRWLCVICHTKWHKERENESAF